MKVILTFTYVYKLERNKYKSRAKTYKVSRIQWTSNKKWIVIYINSLIYTEWMYVGQRSMPQHRRVTLGDCPGTSCFCHYSQCFGSCFLALPA